MRFFIYEIRVRDCSVKPTAVRGERRGLVTESPDRRGGNALIIRIVIIFPF